MAFAIKVFPIVLFASTENQTMQALLWQDRTSTLSPPNGKKGSSKQTQSKSIREIHTPSEIVQHIYQIAKDYTDVLHDHKISYSIAHGTLSQKCTLE